MAKLGRRRYLEDALGLAEQNRSDHKGDRHYSCLAHYFHLNAGSAVEFCDPGRRAVCPILASHRGLRAHEIGILQLADFRDRDGMLFVRHGKRWIWKEHS